MMEWQRLKGSLDPTELWRSSFKVHTVSRSTERPVRGLNLDREPRCRFVFGCGAAFWGLAE